MSVRSFLVGAVCGALAAVVAIFVYEAEPR